MLRRHRAINNPVALLVTTPAYVNKTAISPRTRIALEELAQLLRVGPFRPELELLRFLIAIEIVIRRCLCLSWRCRLVRLVRPARSCPFSLAFAVAFALTVLEPTNQGFQLAGLSS